MIENLLVKNFATIENLEIEFQKGLNIITGETGAGKSIILGALSLILAGRANSEIIRTNEDECVVEALINISKNKTLKQKLEENGFESSDELLIKRTVHREGKNRIFINGSLATLQMLATITADLVDICGQRDHHSLLKESQQQYLFDTFAEIDEDLENFQELFTKLNHLTKELNSIVSPDKEKRTDYLEFVIREIENLNPNINEEQKLLSEKETISNIDELIRITNKAQAIIYEDEDAIHSKISVILKDINNLNLEDKTLTELEERLKSVSNELNDIYNEFRIYSQNLDFTPGRLEEILLRLDEYYNIKRKYGPEISDVLETLNKAKNEIEKTINAEEIISEIKNKISELEKNLKTIGKSLTKKRLSKKKEFEDSLVGELKDVSLENAKIQIAIETHDFLNNKGFDSIRFEFIPNPGESPKPLHKIASGGELSRTMLAIRNVFYGKSDIGVYLFDEIDAGIGGKTAISVAKKLRKISKKAQVICISHLPQIAAAGDCHYTVEKVVNSGRTKSKIRKLDKDDRSNEIARMLSGSTSETALKHANELISQVTK